VVPIGEETWPPGVIKSKGVHEWGMLHVVEVIHPLMPLGQLIFDGPRPVICADCGVPIEDGKVIHFKPERYAVRYHGQTFYLERHLGVTCGCAAKRGFV